MRLSRAGWGGVVALTVGASAAVAEIKTEVVHYREGSTSLKGAITFDSDLDGRRPGILVVHEWWGLNDHARDKAAALAQEGFVAFAIDMYGEGKTTDDPGTAGEWSGYFSQHPEVGKARFEAALAQLKRHPLVDPEQIAAIGYCFGGGIVLQMAQRGADLKGAVSFHGALVPVPAKPGDVRARLLVCHGAADPLVTPEMVTAFEAHLTEIGADWLLIAYGGAKHAFTNPEADSRGMPALAYSQPADERSWRHMLAFFDEIFSE